MTPQQPLADEEGEAEHGARGGCACRPLSADGAARNLPSDAACDQYPAVDPEQRRIGHGDPVVRMAHCGVQAHAHEICRAEQWEHDQSDGEIDAKPYAAGRWTGAGRCGRVPVAGGFPALFGEAREDRHVRGSVCGMKARGAPGTL